MPESSESAKVQINGNADSANTNTNINNNNNKSKNKNRNRNRNRNKNKNSNKTKPEDAANDNGNEDSKNSNSEDAKSSNTGNFKTKNNNRNKKTVKALYKEIEKLLPQINPITINGIQTKNLSTEPLKYLENIINDKKNQNEIFMTFLMKPTDPDFPYDLNLLTVTLSVPQSYPSKLPSPTIMVLNDDIPRGFSVNIEIGFKQIVATALENRLNRKLKNNKKPIEKESKDETKLKNKDKGKKGGDEKDGDGEEEEEEEELKIDMVGGNDLLGMIKTLDKYLEKFLAMEKKDTVKLVKVINRKQKTVSEKEKEQIAEQERMVKEAAEAANASLLTSNKRYAKRVEDINLFKQRLKNNQIKVFKDNAQGSIFKMCLLFGEENLTVEFDENEEVTIEKFYFKFTVPKDYLTNPKKGLKLLVDMSSSFNIELINSIKDTNIRLIFGKLINNMSRNFEIFATEIAQTNCEYMDQSEGTDSLETCNNIQFWSITSQLNFFICNIQKFMNEKSDFQNWYHANKEMNKQLSM